jgi:cell division protein FtsB
MSNTSAQTAPAWSGDVATPDSRRSRCGTRRRLLVLGCLTLLVIAGVAANYGPLRHYQVARDRLEKAAAEVADLEGEKAALQAELAKLSETGYLEGLAREELTYARPDEELYIVTGSSAERSAGSDAAGRGGTMDTSPVPGAADSQEAGLVPTVGVGAVMPGAGRADGFGVGAAAPGAEVSANGGARAAGFLERIVTAISGLF